MLVAARSFMGGYPLMLYMTTGVWMFSTTRDVRMVTTIKKDVRRYIFFILFLEAGRNFKCPKIPDDL